MRKANLFRDGYGNLRTWVESLLVVIILLVVLFSGIGSILAFRAEECHQVGEITGIRIEWRLTAGCFVEYNGEMIPYDAWKALKLYCPKPTPETPTAQLGRQHHSFSSGECVCDPSEPGRRVAFQRNLIIP